MLDGEGFVQTTSPGLYARLLCFALFEPKNNTRVCWNISVVVIIGTVWVYRPMVPGYRTYAGLQTHFRTF